MDKYVIREARIATQHPQGNQTVAFTATHSANATSNNMIPPDNIYYGGTYSANQFNKVTPAPSSSFEDIGHMNTQMFAHNIPQVQSQMMIGIDPRYISNYSDNSNQFVTPGARSAGQLMQSDLFHTSREPNLAITNDTNFRINYQNNNYVTTESNRLKTFTPQLICNENSRKMASLEGRNNAAFQYQPQNMQQRQIQKSPNKDQILRGDLAHTSSDHVFGTNYQNRSIPGPEKNKPKLFIPHVPSNASHATSSATKKISQNQIVTRAERLQALHKSGPRAFSGPVEKVLKWHKALQDIGAFIFYEIVAKCVSIRTGESCSKNLVIRDDNGPAMQVVYYEIDFLLPEIKVPSTVRVIGRVLAGTCRLQAFSVRPATGDDVAMLSRRAAVAAHHVAKLCKEYGITA